MLRESMPRSEGQDDKLTLQAGLPATLASELQRNLREGLSPDLALDLALHEVVVRAADATWASAAAVALVRGAEMVCRATTGDQAPDLGIPLHTHDGLSGACLQTREPQLCFDTESDPRVDAAACRRLGIRSILIAPVLDGENLVGVIEVFSADPQAFSVGHELLLEAFARDCAALRKIAHQITQDGPAQEDSATEQPALWVDSSSGRNSRTDLWTVILGGLVIVSAVLLSLMIGSRTQWLHSSAMNRSAPVPAQPVAAPPSNAATTQAAKTNPSPGQALSGKLRAPVEPAGLVVYDRGKVIFRMGPKGSSATNAAAAAQAGSSGTAAVWLAPDAAEARLQHRVEPEYPEGARATHRSGEVQLEIVVGSDGAVTSVRTVSGDPLLAEAASAAVRNWQYEPYRVRGQLTNFRTGVTLKFLLPD